jgi:muconolactone D-isomerase
MKPGVCSPSSDKHTCCLPEEIIMEFLVHMEVARMEGGEEREKQLREQEAARSRELAQQGMLLRLWRVPGRRANWGVWRADDADRLHDALSSLPLFRYLTITVHPLASHPNDPVMPDAPNGS